MQKFILLGFASFLLSGCLVTSIVGGAVSAATTVAGAAVSTATSVVGAVVPDGD